MKVLEALIFVIGIVFVVAVLSLLLALPIKWCWNYTMPYIFGLIKINWLQAWCLSFLSGVFFKTSLSTKQ